MIINVLVKIILTSLACVATVTDAQQRPQLPGNYPNKPIRVIVAAAQGGGTDITARLVMAKLSERWSHPIVIDNRASGVGGALAVNLGAKADPDGYTLLAVPSSSLIIVPLMSKVEYDVRKDFAPISRLVSGSYVLAVNASLPVNSVRELIAYAKSKPGALSYASPGIGTTGHLTMELFMSMTGVDMVHIPYKGTGPGTIALIGGEVQLLFGGATSLIPHAKSGKLKALAVSSPKRSRLVPDLPTVSEAGVPGFEVTGWYSLLAPAGTPSAIILALNKEITQILNMPNIQEMALATGTEVVPGSPAEFKNAIAKEIVLWTKLFKETNLLQKLKR